MGNRIVVNAIKLDATTVPLHVREIQGAWICPVCGTEYGLYISGEYRQPIYMTRDGEVCVAALNMALRAECSNAHPTEHMKSVDGASAEVVHG
jgi:hypothetical protein